MMNLTQLALNISICSSLLTVMTTVNANTPNHSGEYYIGAKAGYSHYSHVCDAQALDCDPEDFSGGLFAGYQFTDWLAIEGGYDYFGSPTSIYSALEDSSQTVDYKATVQGAELGLKADYYPSDIFGLFGKIGMLGWHAKKTGNEFTYPVDVSDNGVSLMLGIGIEYHFSKRWITRLEYQWFNNVGTDDIGGGDIHFLTLGLRYKFTPPSPESAAAVATAIIIEPRIEVLSEQKSTISFPSNLHRIDSTTALHTFEKILTRLKAHPQAQLNLTGHADATGPERYNQALSEKRAQSVADYFINQGITPERIKLKGMGEHQPIANNDTKQGRARNRRVELTSPSFEIEHSTE